MGDSRRRSSIRERYITFPGVAMILFITFIFYGMIAQPDAFASMIHKIGYGVAWVFDQILWAAS
jgi:hypothetical protein